MSENGGFVSFSRAFSSSFDFASSHCRVHSSPLRTSRGSGIVEGGVQAFRLMGAIVRGVPVLGGGGTCLGASFSPQDARTAKERKRDPGKRFMSSSYRTNRSGSIFLERPDLLLVARAGAAHVVLEGLQRHALVDLVEAFERGDAVGLLQQRHRVQ